MKIRLPRPAVAIVLAILALALAFAALRIWDAMSGDNRRAIVLSAEPPAAGASTIRAATGMAQGSGSVASGSGQEAGIAR